MYNDEEQEIVHQLTKHNCEYPIPVGVTERQLFCLAKCYRDHGSSFLCMRILSNSDHLFPAQKMQLIHAIEDSLGQHNSLGGYWEDSEYTWGWAGGCLLRDIWIKQILAHYGTTVEQQLELELCNVIV